MAGLNNIVPKPDALAELTGRPNNSNLTPAPTTNFAIQQMVTNKDASGLANIGTIIDDPTLRIYSNLAKAGMRPEMPDVQEDYPAYPQRPSDRIRQIREEQQFNQAIQRIQRSISSK